MNLNGYFFACEGAMCFNYLPVNSNAFAKEGTDSFHKQSRLGQRYAQVLNRERFVFDSTIDLFILSINHREDISVEKLGNFPKNMSSLLKNNMSNIASALKYLFAEPEKNAQNMLALKNQQRQYLSKN